MAGRRLLDAALLFNASRTIAKQHFNLRSQQLDVWSKTSSLAKATKNQTDRVTLTVQAASALARRFNGSKESSTTYYASDRNAANEKSIPRQDTVDGVGTTEVKQGLEQDHHYERSERNQTSSPLSDGNLEVQQKQAVKYPTPDGSIPPMDVPANPADTTGINSDTSSQRAEPASKNRSPVEVGTSHAGALSPETSGTSTIPEPDNLVGIQMPQIVAIPEQETLDDINTDVFYSPRVSKMLGMKSNDKVGRDIAVKRAKDTPLDETQLAKGRDQETFNVRESGAVTPVRPDQPVLENSTGNFITSPDEYLHSGLSDNAKDAEGRSASAFDVRQSFHKSKC